MNTVLKLQAEVMKLPQIEFSTFHFFADGMYARSVFRPAGAVIVGKVHKREHFYVVTKGKVAVTDGESEARIYEAGTILVSKPGTKRAVYALEDSVCITVHNTDNTDLDEIERELIEEDETALFDSSNKLIEDRADYQRILRETGFTAQERRLISENPEDQIPMPEGFNVTVSKSRIEGNGLFATVNFSSGEIIAPARIKDKRTPAGRFINHSVKPNAEMKLRGDTIFAVAKRDISEGEEITVYYLQAKAEGEKLCLG